MIYTLGLLVYGGLIVFALWLVARSMYQQYKCNHDVYFENMACHAICSKCRKDLGFIGTVRKERSK